MPDLIRHPGVVKTGAGFHRESWIPAFAGMTRMEVYDRLRRERLSVLIPIRFL